uniref:Uncharacterized protein n=1 Tax=Rhizophora mucronata TaxID=61149 RepID=A0A2P2PK91_RHIMU
MVGMMRRHPKRDRSGKAEKQMRLSNEQLDHPNQTHCMIDTADCRGPAGKYRFLQDR